ncbi:MAG TPA: DNA translocase FtsK 4TM domain-containing protein [Clostridia bacterium]|nr:DNA translocase FtsK 4TM domain-containing protein [Clostridia bacterium]
MAQTTKKKNNTKSKKSTNTTQQSKKSTGNIQGKNELSSAQRQNLAIVLMGVAIFLLCIVFIEGQSVWNWLHNSLLGVFGFCAYLIPLMLVYIAVISALDKPLGSVSSKLIGTGLLIVLIGGVIHIFANDAPYLQEQGIWEQVKNAWDADNVIKSGGVVGAVFGGVLSKLFGRTGASITVVLTLIIGFMLLTGVSLVNLLRAFLTPFKKVGSLADERMEVNLKRQEERKMLKEQEMLQDESDDDDLGKSKRKRKKKDKTLPVVDVGPDASPAFSQEDSFPYDFISTDMPDEHTKVDFPVSALGFGLFDKSEIENDLASVPVPIESIVLGDASNTQTKSKTKREKISVVLDNDDKKDENDDDIFIKQSKSSGRYRKPTIDCLSEVKNSSFSYDTDEIDYNSKKLIETLDSFGVKARIIDVFRGPSVTRYELQPAQGVKISKITNLSDDIAMRLAATGVRIEAPIPGKAAIGIEVPNKSKSMVAIREIIQTPLFKNAKSKLNVALGKDITGNSICADLSKMPHLLIAGTTGSGKSVCLNSMILSLLFNATPDEVKLLMIDPKQVEFTVYNGIPHLLVPVVSDARKASGALGWAVTEMLNRYNLFSEKNVRDITGYNRLADKSDEMERMSQIVIFIDELSDLMMVAPNEVEDSICRLAQMARAAGMHLVIATQRPSVDVITGIIKANIPSRIALYVSSQVDSRTIIDTAGADKLLGNGDMLFNPVGISKPVRVQGCFVSEAEVERVVSFIKNQTQEADYDETIMKEIDKNAKNTKKKGFSAIKSEGDDETDELYTKAIEVVVEAGVASTTLLQRKLRLGYARAARIVDQLEEKGIIGPFVGSKPREVLLTKQEWMEKCAMASEDFNDDNESTTE